jgi:two-component system NarL family sensor kinase
LWQKIKARWKIISLAIVPLIVAVSIIGYTVRHQAIVLEQQQQEVIRAAYLASKDSELENYLTLARRSIAHLYDSGRADAAAMDEAKAILTKLDYGDDGYFFVYDFQGNSLVHPRQPELVGKNQLALKDANGKLVIKDLISRARQGDGFEDYIWEKPSNPKAGTKPKRAYVVALPNWGWMLGTGVYLDDIDQALTKVNSQVRDNIHSTMFWIALTALLIIVIVLVRGLVMNIRVDSKLSVADAKLRVLAQQIVNTQDEVRARIAKELHDGVMNMLVAIKFQIEASIFKLKGTSEQPTSIQPSLEDVTAKLKDTSTEVRRIVCDLHPRALELGLKVAIEQLVLNEKDESLTTEFRTDGEVDNLPATANLVLYRITQEALNNIKQSAYARHVSVKIEDDSHCVKLTIQDDGIGFDVDHINCDPNRGFGLRNMQERVESVGGKLIITSSPQGTTVIVIIPRH